MSHPACALCPVVASLRDGDSYRDPQSGSVSRKIREMPASVAVLGHDQFYRGYSLVIAKAHATELHHLPAPECAQYLDDMARVAAAIAGALRPRKLNYELLGNTVGHLHWHLFPRYEGDPNPTRPIWEHAHDPKTLPPEEYEAIIAAIRLRLP